MSALFFCLLDFFRIFPLKKHELPQIVHKLIHGKLMTIHVCLAFFHVSVYKLNIFV